MILLQGATPSLLTEFKLYSMPRGDLPVTIMPYLGDSQAVFEITVKGNELERVSICPHNEYHELEHYINEFKKFDISSVPENLRTGSPFLYDILKGRVVNRGDFSQYMKVKYTRNPKATLFMLEEEGEEGSIYFILRCSTPEAFFLSFLQERKNLLNTPSCTEFGVSLAITLTNELSEEGVETILNSKYAPWKRIKSSAGVSDTSIVKVIKERIQKIRKKRADKKSEPRKKGGKADESTLYLSDCVNLGLNSLMAAIDSPEELRVDMLTTFIAKAVLTPDSVEIVLHQRYKNCSAEKMDEVIKELTCALDTDNIIFI